MAKRFAAAAQQASPPSPPPHFTFGDLLRAARQAHREFRHQDRLEQRLGWPHRKVLWLEHNRVRPTADDLAQLTATLPILRLLLDHAQPARREIETAGRL